MASCAYVTFVMMNDSYVPGALVFAYALRKQAVKGDILCLVTPEVSSQARTALSVVFDDVLEVQTLTIYHTNRHTRQDRPFLFTRFQAFRLGKDGDLGKGYDKIILADADILPLSDYESLIDIPAPAGILNECKDHCVASTHGKYIDTRSDNSHEWHWHTIYQNYPHGAMIPSAVTNRVKRDSNNLGINACLYVLAPSMAQYHQLITDMHDTALMRQVAYFPWPEMQYLTLRFSGLWHNLDLRYASFNGYPALDALKGTHFAGLKPWSIHNKSVHHYAKFEDYQCFYRHFLDMFHAYPPLKENKKLMLLHTFCEKKMKHF